MKTWSIVMATIFTLGAQFCLAQTSGNLLDFEAYYKEFERGMSLQVAEVCLRAKVSGQKDLATPWPLEKHGERHTQIQQVISAHAANARYCLERFGELSEPIQFLIFANGTINVEDSSVNSPAAECISRMLKNIKVGTYFCDMNVPYKWDGKFPLVNTERKEFR